MRVPVKTVDPYRKKPRQARAVATVDSIFEATARILHSQGDAGLNTNAIAELAGISVGTLYQYFPNKKAILIAVARRELDKTSGAVIAGLRRESETHSFDPARAAVRALLQAFGGRQRTRKVLIETLIVNGLTQELARPVDAVANAIAVQLATDQARVLPPARLYVMTRAVIGAIRAAVMEQSAYLNATAFEDELVQLARHCMAPRVGDTSKGDAGAHCVAGTWE